MVPSQTNWRGPALALLHSILATSLRSRIARNWQVKTGREVDVRSFEYALGYHGLVLTRGNRDGWLLI